MFLQILYIFPFVYATNADAELNNNCDNLKPPSNNETFELFKQWKYINFTWPTHEEYEKAVSSRVYIPGNSVILGVKYYKNKFYLAMPKIKPGSPVTIAYITKQSAETTNPLLTPYPNWPTHLTDSCSETLQNLQSMEIDENGLMWIIDGRRIDSTNKKCPPKIVLLDLNQDGLMVHSYILPDDICSHESCFMNDVVLDNIDGGFAYITDASFTDPGLIIYSRKQNRAWKVRDSSMFAEEDAVPFCIHGIPQTKRNTVNGIGLAPKKQPEDRHRTLYYTAFSAFTLYSIDSVIVRNESLATSKNVGKFIISVGNKTAQSAGMVVDSKRQLYYGLVAQDAVLKWDTSKPISTVKIIEVNPKLMPWPDSYTFDDEGYLYVIASNVGRFGAGKLSIENDNFKLVKLYTGTCSYINSKFN